MGAVDILKKNSSGAHFLFVRHYARSGFALADLHSSRIRSTHVERNAQSIVLRSHWELSLGQKGVIGNFHLDRKVSNVLHAY